MANPTDDDTVTDEVLEDNSFLSMSDEEMMNASPPGEVAAVVEPPQEQAQVAGVADEVAGDEPAAEEVADAADKDKELVADTKPAAAEKKVDVVDPKVEADKPKEPAAIDYKAEYERLLAPFKANGRDIKVDSVDDAVALMQMGANYNKKMAALKPNLKLMKMLENNGFLSEDKIGFLIDLGKKDPAAISKLVKDSGVDPLDLDADKASTYKQNTYAVDDREIELDTVLDELQSSPTYTRTLDLVSNKWDVASKQAISQAPQLLKVLDGHIANGIYDLISAEMERARVFGRLNGLSDLEAYRQTGDAIQARGGFNHLAPSQGKTQPAEPEIVLPKPKVEDEGLNAKRRAASGTKSAAPSATQPEFNPLAMSDAEFMKQAAPVYR